MRNSVRKAEKSYVRSAKFLAAEALIWLPANGFVAFALAIGTLIPLIACPRNAPAAVSAFEDPSTNAGAPTFVASEFTPQSEMKIVAYGDMRFTRTSNVTDTNPRMRQWLAAKVGDERPDLLLLSGDMPMNGSKVSDWNIYRHETASWAQHSMHVYPTIGNHEIKNDEESGIRNYFDAYPELQGNRYYSVLAGSVEVIALDSTEKRDPGSPQYAWLDAQLAHLPPQVDFVFFLFHMPLMTDVQSQFIVNLPSEADTRVRLYLESKAQSAHARFIVVNGHIHNYERFLHKGITYLVTGGGGAEPYPILIRGEQDLYKDAAFPVFHYLVLQLRNRRLDVTMYKVVDPKAPNISVEIKDTFSINAR